MLRVLCNSSVQYSRVGLLPAETQLHDGDEVGINFVMKIMVVGLGFICAGAPCQTTDDPSSKHRKNVCKREDIKCDIKRTYLADLTEQNPSKHT